jgi:phosphatidylserine/phosphatidylglycerophosphate/cardiolipin synthase-like enzyme
MAIIDKSVAMMSTGNFNPSNFCNLESGSELKRCDRDFTYVTKSPKVLRVMNQVFQKDLESTPYNLEAILNQSNTPELTVSPYSLKPLVNALRSAQKSILIQTQYLKDPTFNNEILNALARGVAVTLMTASACSFGRPSDSEVKQWNTIYPSFEKAGAQIRVFSRSIKVKGVPGYLHAKALVIDGKIGWTGSTNGSTTSLTANREYGIFFNTKEDVKLLVNSIKSDFNNPNSETWQEGLNCTKDGIF